MSLSQEELKGLADAVFMWRLQECIYISFYAFYAYYILTTLDEEISIMLPQKWNHGKVLFLVIRYGTCVFVALQLSRDFRNYFEISLVGCKGLLIAYDGMGPRALIIHLDYNIYSVSYRLASLACDVSLGLCLSALLQVGRGYMAFITLLSAVPSLVGFAFGLISDIQYPAEPVSALDEELGYPCYVPSSEQWTELTAYGLGRNIRRYIYFATTCVLLIAAVTTLVRRYKGHKGRLVRVLRRDGGAYYIALAAFRFATALTNTPAIVSTYDMDSHAASIVLDSVNTIVIPILAQRLMINLRKADYMGKRPFASTLLFAPPLSGSEEGVGDNVWVEASNRRHGMGGRGSMLSPSSYSDLDSSHGA
ncbi:hypothetical protein NMY22_g7189 [Coprinellus aureogranulatus]|nr:hypothetical protein NMY22_g7189 [Coprinellus aureogranulatus]